MVSLCWGVCKASRWRHRATVPAHRHACARNTVTLQLQDGGHALLWNLWLLLLMLVRFMLIAKKKEINRVYCCCCRCILHLQQYSRRLNLFFVVVILTKQIIGCNSQNWLFSKMSPCPLLGCEPAESWNKIPSLLSLHLYYLITVL